MSSDPRYLWHSLQLARKGAGSVAPNPMVGACLVHEGSIISEGFHERYGGPHAEVNALRDITDRALLARSTLFVSLEPCCHFGKTPPCTSLILEKGIREVVIGCQDPFPPVSGGGAALLEMHGVKVVKGLLESEARWLNRRFITFHEKKRPYIILKWAETHDHFIARRDFTSRWISSESSRALVHRWRREEAAILVGTATALHDNPRLTARNADGSPSSSQPLRVVLDKRLAIPPDYHLFDEAAATLIVTEKLPSSKRVSYLTTAFDETLLPTILKTLFSRNCLSLTVEGGSATLQSFIASGLWDEIRVFSAPHAWGEGIFAPRLPVVPLFKKRVGEDTLSVAVNPESGFTLTGELDEF